jgi:hypothetical protein
MTDRDQWQPTVDPLVGLTDDERLAAAIQERSQLRDLTMRATELATLAGTLRDLAERRAGVSLLTVSGRTHRGSLIAVSVDHVVLATASGHQVLVRLDAIAVTRPDPDSRAPLAQGDRDPATDQLLAERASLWVEDRPMLAVSIRGVPDLLRGRLLAVAEDLLTLSLDGARTPAYVTINAVEAVALEGVAP